MKQAYDFADQYQDWMQARMDALPQPVSFQHGVALSLNGQEITLNLKLDLTRKNTSISLKNNELIVLSNKHDPSVRIMRWLKTYAKDVLQKKSQEKALSISKNIEKVSVRDTKSRWGSCSSDKTLSYSWRLIFAPPEALDYVVAHEVAHLKHLNHSKAFWNLCRELSDDFINGQFWMRNHGHELMKYGAIKEPLKRLVE